MSQAVYFPQVSTIQPKTTVGESKSMPKGGKVGPGEFDKVLNQISGAPGSELIREPLKFSAHASQRVRDRAIPLDAAMMAKLNQAMDQAESKGLDETLVLTPDAAFIVSVKNRTVVTALDRGSFAAGGNVFTNIDGAVVV